jgi:hypothetical protein
LVDLVVVAAILIAVISLVLLRLSGNRESARRVACEENLRNIALAAESYALRFGQFPIGTQNPTAPIRSEPSGYHHNWIEGLLPMMEQQELYNRIDFDVGVYAAENKLVAATALPTLRCPASMTTLAENATCYAGVVGSKETPIDSDCDGMFVLNRPIAPEDASDGRSFVLLGGEKSVDWDGPAQWNSGTRASLRNAGHPINAAPQQPLDPPPLDPPQLDPLFVGGFSSNHPGGAYFLLVDGSFRFYADDTDIELLRQLASRSDGPPVGDELRDPVKDAIDEAIDESTPELEPPQ